MAEQAFNDRATDCIADAAALVHGATLVINAVLVRKGALTGLITMRVFRDVAEIATEKGYDGSDLQLDLPEPIVPCPQRLEADERTPASGVTLKDLDETQVMEAVRKLLAHGAEPMRRLPDQFLRQSGTREADRRHPRESRAIRFRHAFARGHTRTKGVRAHDYPGDQRLREADCLTLSRDA